MSEPMRPAWSRDSVAVRLHDEMSFDAITPSWAWGGSTGRGVRVAVIDSGIEANHPALDGCVDIDQGVAINVDDAGRVVEQRGPHRDSVGHGTACAGIIHSLAPDARLTSVKVLGAGLTGRAAAF